MYLSLVKGLIPARMPMAHAGSDDPRPGGGMAQILAETAADYGLSPSQLQGNSRVRTISWPRQDFMWRCRQVKWADGSHRYSYPMIGGFLDMDHTTIIHGVRAHAARLAALTEAVAA